MAVGNQVTKAQIDQALSNYSTQLRNLMRQIFDEQTFITWLGASGLEALGYSTADAALVQNMMSYMNTFALVYYGMGTQGSEFNFDNALAGLWAGN
jgi:hypothetical protein